jgi:hypothetical protein
MAFALVLFILPIIRFQNGLAGSIYLSAADQQAAVDVHNQYRIEAGATAMQKLVRAAHKSLHFLLLKFCLLLNVAILTNHKNDDTEISEMELPTGPIRSNHG